MIESDEAASLNKVEDTTWCCWSGSQFKCVKVACDETGNKPTHLEAARTQHLKLIAMSLQSTGRQAIQLTQNASRRRAALEEAGNVEATTTFEHLRFAGLAQRRTEAQQVTVDEQIVAEACAAQQR